jgi:hypothetical protein
MSNEQRKQQLAHMRLLNAIFRRKPAPMPQKQKNPAPDWDYKPTPSRRWRPFPILLLVLSAIYMNGCAGTYSREQFDRLAMLQTEINIMPAGKDKLMAQMQLEQLREAQAQTNAQRVSAWAARTAAINSTPVYTPPTVITVPTPAMGTLPVWTPPINH